MSRQPFCQGDGFEKRIAERFSQFVSVSKEGDWLLADLEHKVVELQVEEAEFREWLRERAEKRGAVESVGEEVVDGGLIGKQS
jgi:flavin-dependent dehydrogenase